MSPVKLAAFGVAALMIESFAPAALITVGGQFTGAGNGGGTPLGAADTAGVVSQNNWNVLGGQSGGPTALADSTGTATGINISWSADDSWTTGTSANFGTNTADFKLLSGEDKTARAPRTTRSLMFPPVPTA